MASGLLGKAVLVANVPTIIYTVPANVEFVTLNVNVVNTSVTIGDTAKVNVAVSSLNVPNREDYVEYGVALTSNGGVLERTGVICSSGEKIVVTSTISNVVIRIHGIEELM